MQDTGYLNRFLSDGANNDERQAGDNHLPRVGLAAWSATVRHLVRRGGACDGDSGRQGIVAQELNDGRHLIDARGPVPFLPIHNCQFVAADEGREIDL